ncbi:hypothetical protein BDZ89DRAFT_1033206 [Hymenopellis radicata]|nr:hypothetical protein BDZ89DRAFT_1033206 [Hymenopellis radicata]
MSALLHVSSDTLSQLPQCEGASKSHAFFGDRAPRGARQLYRAVKQRAARYSRSGGWRGTGWHQGPPARVCCSHQVKRSEVPEILWALQTHIGHNVSKISVALPLEGAFIQLIRRAVGSMDERRPTKRDINLTVDMDKPHELSLRKTPSSVVVFDIKDHGVNSIAHTVPIDDEERMFYC